MGECGDKTREDNHSRFEMQLSRQNQKTEGNGIRNTLNSHSDSLKSHTAGIIVEADTTSPLVLSS